jgi:adenine specific DNA methylase Mod
MIKSRGRKQKKKYIKYTKVCKCQSRKKQNRLRAFFTVCARRCYHDYIEKKGKGGEITYAENQQTDSGTFKSGLCHRL